MSFGFSVGDLVAVIQLANQVRKRFLDAPQHFTSISDEVKSLSSTLRDLEDLVSERELKKPQLARLKDCANGSERVLSDLNEVLDRYQVISDRNAGSKLSILARRTWKRLEFEPDDVRDLRTRLISNVTLLNAFYASLADQTSKELQEGIDRLHRFQMDDSRQRILGWLNGGDYAAQQSELVQKRQPYTGQWLLKSEEYQTWTDGDASTFFCKGMPGAGKTFMACTVIENLQERQQRSQDTGLAFLFFDYARSNRKEQPLAHVLASLLEQLTWTQPIPSDLKALYDKHSERRSRPTVEELKAILSVITSRFRKTYIVIDALDEGRDDDQTAINLIKQLQDLQAVDPSIKLMATSRDVSDITCLFDEQTVFEIRANSEDLKLYARAQMPRMAVCVQKNQSLQDELVETIADAADGMFLVARLHIDSLRGKRTPKAIKTSLNEYKLRQTGSGALDLAYKDAIRRMEGQTESLGFTKMIFAWIARGVFPMTMEQLRHALSMEGEDSEIDDDNLPEAEDVVAVCAGLIEIETESKVVRFVHYTTQEFFDTFLPVWMPDCHYQLASACISYIASDCVATGPFNDVDFYKTQLQQYPFYGHAASSWGVHAREDKTGGSLDQILRFLRNDLKVRNAYDAFVLGESPSEPDFRDTCVVRGTHYVAGFGVDTCLEALISEGWNPFEPDSEGKTPLFFAAMTGMESTAKILLNRPGSDLTYRDKLNRTAIWYAARHGRANTVRLLLEYEEVNVNWLYNFGRTILSEAASFGRDEVIKVILAKDASSINWKTEEYGETPIYRAVAKGMLTTTELLIKNGADVVNGGSPARSLLTCAIANRDPEMVDLLLKSGAPWDFIDSSGDTPMHFAAFENNAYLVKKFLDFGVPIDILNAKGNVAVFSALLTCNDSVINLLIERGIDVNCRDSSGTTLISHLAWWCRRHIITRIAKLGADINATNTETGETALMQAAIQAWPKTTQVLLDNGADVDAVDAEGRSALIHVVSLMREKMYMRISFRHGDVLLMLLDAGASLDRGEIEGKDAISFAIEMGMDEVARVLEEYLSPEGISKEARAAIKPSDSMGLNVWSHHGPKSVSEDDDVDRDFMTVGRTMKQEIEDTMRQKFTVEEWKKQRF